MKSPERRLWTEAMQKEIDLIRSRQVWTLVPRNENDKVIGCRWVFTRKTDDKGKTVRHKARLVAHGHRQIKGINYDEVFSPVVNFNIIRLMFTLFVSKYKWKHLQLDITGAYLYAPLKSKILMSQPKGFVDPNKPNHVCLLKRALYGLHQSGLEWYREIHTTLLNLGFKSLSSAICVYVCNNDTLLLLYVDDIVLICKTLEIGEHILKLLKNKFDIKVLGKTSRLLGVTFEQNASTLTLNQEDYISKIFDKFNQRHHIPLVNLPMVPGLSLSRDQSPKTENEVKEMANVPYRSLIGCLSFIASRTRPDITFSVNLLSQFQSNPGKIHWDCLIKVLGYTYATRSLKLNLSNFNDNIISLFSDADFASSKDDRRSTTGTLVLAGKTPILWSTTKQKVIALSTMESEAYALAECGKQATWLHNVFTECKERRLIPDIPGFKIYADNQASISFCLHPTDSSRARHIDARKFFVKDLVDRRIVAVEYVRSKNNLADCFTKPYPKVPLQLFRNCIFIETERVTD